MRLTKDKLPNDKPVSNIRVLETDFLETFGGSLIFNFHSTESEQCVLSQIGRSRILKFLLSIDHIWCRSLAHCLVKHLVKTAIAEFQWDNRYLILKCSKWGIKTMDKK